MIASTTSDPTGVSFLVSGELRAELCGAIVERLAFGDPSPFSLMFIFHDSGEDLPNIPPQFRDFRN
jgi:hypothetical protein